MSTRSSRAAKRKAPPSAAARGSVNKSSRTAADEQEPVVGSDFTNADVYGFGSGGSTSNNKDEEAPLSWRLDEADSLSDWKIVVTRTGSGDNGGAGAAISSSVGGRKKKPPPSSATYHVHKNILAVGPKRSEYFASLFKSRNQLAELADSTSEIELEDSAADAFPVMLDYIYDTRPDTDFSKDNITTENAVALRHLAQYFQIGSLFATVTTFIQRDLCAEKSPTYILEATIYGDERLANAAMDVCADTIGEIEATSFVKLPSHLFVKILSSSKLKRVYSLELSWIVAHYCQAHIADDEIDEEMFATMTNETIMPDVDKEAALPLLKSLTELSSPHSSSQIKASTKKLKTRCMDAISDSWTDIAELKGKKKLTGKGTGSKKGTDDVSDLPDDLQVELLRSCLQTAKEHLEKKIQEKYDVVTQKDRVIAARDSTIASLRLQVSTISRNKAALDQELRNFVRVPIDHTFGTCEKDLRGRPSGRINKTTCTYAPYDSTGNYGKISPHQVPPSTGQTLHSNGHIIQDSRGYNWAVYYYKAC